MSASGRITTQAYVVGPYRFWSSLPVMGLSTDQPEWEVSYAGEPRPGRYASLEDAMRAALAFSQPQQGGGVR